MTCSVAVLAFFLMQLSEVHGIRQKSHETDYATYGKEFTFAFFSTDDCCTPSDSNFVNDVYISSQSDTDCTLSYDDKMYEVGRRKQLHIHVPAQTIHKQSLPDSTGLPWARNKIMNKGLYLNCSSDVWVYAYNQGWSMKTSSDSYTILPHKMLSTEYLVPGIDNNPIVGIIATQPNTVVNVYLKSTCSSEFRYYDKVHIRYVTAKNGEIRNLPLDTNDVMMMVHTPFSCRTTYDCDFGGTLIKSDKPIAVFSGSVFYYPNNRFASHLMLQVPPLSAYSTTVIVPRVPAPAWKMNIRILSSEDNTSVSVISQPKNTTNLSIVLGTRGDYEDFHGPANTDVIIQSDKPVMVVQNTFFWPESGDLSMFIPGTNLYDTEYLIQSFHHYNYTYPDQRDPELSVVSKTKDVSNILINGKLPSSTKWIHLNGSDYSVGTMNITEFDQFHIRSATPVMVRLHQFAKRSTHGYIGGYHLPNQTQIVKGAVQTKCLPDRWLVSVSLDEFPLYPKDNPNIFLGNVSCSGSLEGDKLIFNFSFEECNTSKSVVGNQITFRNTVWYTPGAFDGGFPWVDNITCTPQIQGPVLNSTASHVSISGKIQGPAVHISFFKDASFQTPFVESKDKKPMGGSVYVEVAASRHDLIMAVNSCTAHSNHYNDTGSTVEHPLISHGCPVDKRTQIVSNRNELMRFKFDVFDLPRIDTRTYVTCDVTFCDMMDFSPHCQVGCHPDQHPDVVGK